MSALAEQVRMDAVRPALLALEPVIPYTRVAENLVLGTAAHESKFTYRYQEDGGPARGLWQIEEPTFRDLYGRYLERHPVLKGKVDTLWPNDLTDPWLQIVGNDRFSAAICRLKYWDSPLKLPADPNDVFEMGRLYKAAYNTPSGSATAQEWVDDYRFRIEDMTLQEIAALNAQAKSRA